MIYLDQLTNRLFFRVVCVAVSPKRFLSAGFLVIDKISEI